MNVFRHHTFDKQYNLLIVSYYLDVIIKISFSQMLYNLLSSACLRKTKVCIQHIPTLCHVQDILLLAASSWWFAWLIGSGADSWGLGGWVYFRICEVSFVRQHFLTQCQLFVCLEFSGVRRHSSSYCPASSVLTSTTVYCLSCKLKTAGTNTGFVPIHLFNSS